MILIELSKSIKDLTMVQLMSRSNNKDPEAVKAQVEQKIASGYIYEGEYYIAHINNYTNIHMHIYYTYIYNTINI